jgi:hypothetical protein
MLIKNVLKLISLSALSMLLPFTMVACSEKEQHNAASYTRISGAEAKALMDTETEYVIIDARTQAEYDEAMAELKSALEVLESEAE